MYLRRFRKKVVKVLFKKRVVNCNALQPKVPIVTSLFIKSSLLISGVKAFKSISGQSAFSQGENLNSTKNVQFNIILPLKRVLRTGIEFSAACDPRNLITYDLLSKNLFQHHKAHRYCVVCPRT